MPEIQVEPDTVLAGTRELGPPQGVMPGRVHERKKIQGDRLSVRQRFNG